MIHWTEPAERDLEQHYAFMAMKGFSDPEYVIHRIIDAAEELVYHPKMGRHIKSNLYSLVLKEPEYVIHYYIEDDIFITRVFHHRQNRNI